MNSRSQAINRYHHHKMPGWYGPASLGILVTGLVLLPVMFSLLAKDGARQITGICLAILVIFVLIPSVVVIGHQWKFAFRRRLLEIGEARGMKDFRVSKFATGALSTIYLQAKINEIHDHREGVPIGERGDPRDVERAAVQLMTAIGILVLVVIVAVIVSALMQR